MIKFPLAVVLLSGGMDSAVTLAIAIDRGFVPLCLSFNYGQRHSVELRAAKALAHAARVKRHVIVKSAIDMFGKSALTTQIPVPKYKKRLKSDIPVTYVPARNTIFLSYALAFLDAENADAIFIGVNALDYSGYPDCRAEYIKAYQKLANLATRRGVEGKHPIRIEAPLLHMSKTEIVKKGLALGVPFELTFSCYNPDRHGRACKECDACVLRRKAFVQAKIQDPTQYQK